MFLRLRRHHNRFAFGQNRSSGSRLGIAGTKMLVILNFSLQQPLRISRGDPSALLGDADGHNFVFIFVDGVENRRGREQGDLMLTAAPAKQDADSNFLHGLNVAYRIFFPKADSANSTARSAVRLCSSITGFTSTISKRSMRPWSAMISMARCASRYVAPPRTGVPTPGASSGSIQSISSEM